ncbi:MAG: polyketide synthase dehydratase domain-containing protein [Spirochaetales bacterium]|nr:polyketide synthase dehydratase domain-containing protein [Spirochaetales bacterium]
MYRNHLNHPESSPFPGFDMYPHLKDCTTRSNNKKSIAFNIVIDARQHLYVNDHIIGDMPTVPASMIMEIFLEVAFWIRKHYLKNDFALIGLENLSMKRPLKIAFHLILEIEIVLCKVHPGNNSYKIELEMITKRTNNSGMILGRCLNASCCIAFSNQFPEIKYPGIENLNFNYYHFVPNKDIYSEHFLPNLKTLFHSKTGRCALDEKKSTMIGEYNCRNLEKGYIRNMESSFIISPMGYDACIQYLAFFGWLKDGVARLPFDCKKLFVCNMQPPEKNCKVIIKYRESKGEDLSADFWGLDEKNRIIVYANEFTVRKKPNLDYKTVVQDFEAIMKKRMTTEFIDW